jgi:hypothetical protein
MEQKPTSSSSQKHYSNVIASINRGAMIEAHCLLGADLPGVGVVAYQRETLYNVLLDGEHGVMGVQGLICETLHPDSLIARLGEFSAEERDYFIRECK